MKKVSIILLTIALSTGFFYYFKNRQVNTKFLLSNKNCQLPETSCTFKNNSEKLIHVEFTPNKINNSSPFIVKIKNISSYKIEKFNIRFQGVDMDLSSFSTLTATDGIHFQSQNNLPYCTLKKMAWKMFLNFKINTKSNKTKEYYVVHNFEVIN